MQKTKRSLSTYTWKKSESLIRTQFGAPQEIDEATIHKLSTGRDGKNTLASSELTVFLVKPWILVGVSSIADNTIVNLVPPYDCKGYALCVVISGDKKG